MTKLDSWLIIPWLFVHCFQIKLEFGVLVFLEGGKLEKNPLIKATTDDNSTLL